MSPKLLINNRLSFSLISKLCQNESQKNLINKNVKRFMSSMVSSKRETFPERCVSLVPEPIQPYLRLMRLDKPTGSWLLLWPSFWSISLATPSASLPSLTTLSLFGLGSVVMRGAGCVINDLWDKDFDKRVQRTKSRPLASNQLSTTDAFVFLGGLLGSGLYILLKFDMNRFLKLFLKLFLKSI
jgi:4-hydroxybenzoate polyprenyltransferase